MPEAHFSWRDAGVMRASLLLSAGNLMCEAQNRCALSAEKQKAPKIFGLTVIRNEITYQLLADGFRVHTKLPSDS